MTHSMARMAQARNMWQRKVQASEPLRVMGLASGRSRRAASRRELSSKRGCRSSKEGRPSSGSPEGASRWGCCLREGCPEEEPQLNFRRMAAGWFGMAAAWRCLKWLECFISIFLFFDVINFLPKAIKALLDGGFGSSEDVGDFAQREFVEAEVEERTFVGIESGDDAVVVGRCFVDFLGDGVVDPVFEWDEKGLAYPSANLCDGDVEGHAADPGVAGALTAEGGPRLPEGAGDFLIEVADAVGLAVGEVEADLEDGVLAAVEHVKELSRVFGTVHIKVEQGFDGGVPRLCGSM